jgi:sorting nexin-8
MPVVEEQGDLARLTNTLRVVIEVNEHCWRGDECDLSNGVRQGLGQLATYTQHHSDLCEARVGYAANHHSCKVHPPDY